MENNYNNNFNLPLDKALLMKAVRSTRVGFNGSISTSPLTNINWPVVWTITLDIVVTQRGF